MCVCVCAYAGMCACLSMCGLSSNLDRVTATKVQNMMLTNANTMVVEDASFKP